MPALSEYSNVYDSALQVLDEKGFQVWYESGPDLYCAEKDGWDFAAESPIGLLGLVALWEQIGPAAYEEYWWRVAAPTWRPRYRSLPNAAPKEFVPVWRRDRE